MLPFDILLPSVKHARCHRPKIHRFVALQAAIRLPDVHVRQKLDSLKMCVHAVPFPLQQQQLSHAVLL